MNEIEKMTRMLVMLVSILFFFSVVFIVPLTVDGEDNIQNRTLYVDDNGNADYMNIQDCIDAANVGDTVYVHSGTYYENIMINKTITLVGENAENTIIDGNGRDVDVLYIKATYVNISEFTLKNGGNGIFLSSSSAHTSSHNNISRCIVSNNYWGIDICLSSGNQVSNCIIIKNEYGGIHMYSALCNQVTYCNISENGCSIEVTAGERNSIHHNNFINNPKQAECHGWNYWDDSVGEGNYWSDYAGEDADGDGIGDMPYNISSWCKDDYPFMNPLNLDLPDLTISGKEKSVEKFEVKPIIMIVVAIIIISMAVVGVTYKRKSKKQREKQVQEQIPEEVKPLMVACPYCQTSFQITPTAKPFKIKCPTCNKKSVLR